MRRLMLLGVLALLATSGCATYQPAGTPSGGRAYFIRRFFGTTLWYCDATSGQLICGDAATPPPPGTTAVISATPPPGSTAVIGTAPPAPGSGTVLITQ